jgi:hypothetical protein
MINGQGQHYVQTLSDKHMDAPDGVLTDGDHSHVLLQIFFFLFNAASTTWVMDAKNPVYEYLSWIMLRLPISMYKVGMDAARRAASGRPCIVVILRCCM